jgi:hypothetical protein
VDTLKVDMLLVDTLKVDMLLVDTLKVDMLVDTVKVAMARADTVKVAGDQELLHTVVSKITGMQVNRLQDMIKCFKAKAWLTKWVQAAAMVVVSAADTVVLATVQ